MVGVDEKVSLESLLNKVFKVIGEVYQNEVEVITEAPKYKSYPFPTAYKGHNEWIDYILNNKDISYLTLPTGSGKTAIYLTAAAESGLRTLVIVPRNGLQMQIASYSTKIGVPILYLFDRIKMCNKDSSQPPCLRKFRKGNKWYLKLKDQIIEYPCPDCPYEIRKNIIKDLFSDNKCIAVMNQGNFWFLKTQAEFVIIDEADETLRSITEAVSYPEWYESKDPYEVLTWMKEKVESTIKKVLSALEEVRNENELMKLNLLLNKLERKLRKIEFFMTYPSSKLITYIKGKSTYVEVFDEPINVVRRLFPDTKVCLVTATPPLNVKTSDSTLPFRAKVIYAPIGNMSVRNIFGRNNEDLLEKAAEFIVKTYDYVIKLTGMKKAPIHCGNLGKHGIRIYEILKENGFKVLLMEEGNQVQTIKEFLQGDYDFLCVVAAEYGYDWGFSPVQYILKVPYADLGDPRLQAIKKLMGEDKFSEWYRWDALTRVIQACGRNARGPNDFGVTIILDSCFEKLYKQFEDKIPKWFKERLIWLSRGGDDVQSR